MQRAFTFGLATLITALPGAALAQGTQNPNIGQAPPEEKALVAGPKAIGDAPAFEIPKVDTTNASLSAGGLIATGNTRTTALTLNAILDARRGMNGFGASLLGNYAESAPFGEASKATAENLQARGRYDRYLTDRFAVFLLGTGRYDKFQGLAFRLNVDPGVKYVFFKNDSSALWGELGYDLQHDIRTEQGRVRRDDDGNPTGESPRQKTLTDHSARAFVGFRHAFNDAVTLSTGVEYLQSFIETDIAKQNSRLNFDAIVAANLGAGFAFGVGFNARYDRSPLDGRKALDTATTLSVIYSFSDVPKAAAPVCPEPEPCPVYTPPPPVVVEPLAPAAGTAPATTEPAAPATPANDAPLNVQ